MDFLSKSKKVQTEVKNRNFLTYVLALAVAKAKYIPINQESGIKLIGKVLRSKNDTNTAIKLASFSKQNELRVFKGHTEGQYIIFSPVTFQEALIVAND